MLMDLFNAENQPANLLPFDGTVEYFGKIFNPPEAQLYYEALFNQVDWKNDEVVIMGKRLVTKRKVAWYGDKAFSYTYSGITKTALLWTPALMALKKIVETKTHCTYNSCLLNLYHNGDEGMAYHSDDEKMLAPKAAIASLSFGAERKFLFRHKTKDIGLSVFLENGSLLLMKDETQIFWKHRLPTTKKATTPRINLTFRTMVAP